MQDPMEEFMFTTGAFSKLCGLSVETLYHYEAMELLLPARTDRQSGYRYYEAHQLMIVNKILALKDAGCSLAEIAEILRAKPAAASLIELLSEKAGSLEKTLQLQTARLERIHTNIFLLKNGGIPAMHEIAIKRVEPILAATIRKAFHKSRFDEELEALWGEVNRHILAAGGRRTVPCMMLYHTGWWNLKEDGRLDVEVAEPLHTQIKEGAAVSVTTLPAEETMACIIHKGPFSTIGKTFESFFAWIKENGYTPNGPLREIYHKGDWAAGDENEYITELQIPVKISKA